MEVHCIFIPHSPFPAWSHLILADFPRTVFASGLDTPPACAPSAVLFCRGISLKKSVCTPEKSDSNWKRAQKIETRHQCGKGWEREIMAGSPDTTISWQEKSACASQITSRSTNHSSAQRSKELRHKGPILLLTLEGKPTFLPPRLDSLTSLAPHAFQTFWAVARELCLPILLSQTKSLSAERNASRSRAESGHNAITLLPVLLWWEIMDGFDQSRMDKQPKSWLFPVCKDLVALSDHNGGHLMPVPRLFHPWKRT